MNDILLNENIRSDCFLSGLLLAIAVQLFGWSRTVVWL